MVDVSAAWKELHNGDLLPETFVEVTCAITENGAQEEATSYGEDEESRISNSAVVSGNSTVTATQRYATLERNLWVLDGTRNIANEDSWENNTGFVSTDETAGFITLDFPASRRATVGGITIVWSNEFGEYPTRFGVLVKDASRIVASTTVENNSSITSLVDLEISEYNTIIVEPLEWCLPNHRFRIERVYVGHIMTFTKNELLSYTHEQTGNLNSAEIPKNSITFSVDNTDGRWNPSNPNGLERYLSERQRVTVRYGMDVNGAVEWIKGGTFYLSEWTAPANGMEASFVARDALEFLLNEEFPSQDYTAYSDALEYAYTSDSLDTGANKLAFSSNVFLYEGPIGEGYSKAEVIQMIANASCCVMRFDRDGVLRVESVNTAPNQYLIPASMSYSHPETTLSKPLKNVSVSYGDGQQRVMWFGGFSGETQTVDNPLVIDAAQAENIGAWVKQMLGLRTSVSGEFRGDPRLDLFDVVDVETKYGTLSRVAIESIKYTYSGSFNATYSGRMIAEKPEISPLGV